MKKISISIVLLLYLVFNLNANPLKPTPKVDERSELMSVIFRLAEAEEYVNNTIKTYTDDVDRYFEPYKNDTLIKWIPKLRKQYGIGYDAVASYSIHLEIRNDQIYFLNNVNIENIDNRWEKEIAEEFLEKLNDFYTKSKFNEFFSKHKSIYAVAEERYNHVLNRVDFEWFEKYYGEKPEGEFYLIINLLNRGNYGPSINYTNGEKDIYAIMGPEKVDSLGLPIYSSSQLSIIIHEFNHSFCNSLADEIYPQVKNKMQEFYKSSADILKRQAYGTPSTMLREILVRASVIQYYKKDNIDKKLINRMIKREQQRGFLWIDQLCDKLSEYEQQRDKFPTLQSFMPKIIELIESLSPSEIRKAYKADAIKISTSITNGTTDLDPKTKTIHVFFDKPMNIEISGASYGKRGKELFPNATGTDWNKETKKEWIMYFTLEPDKEYSISFPSDFFMGENEEPILETYFLDFKTRKE